MLYAGDFYVHVPGTCDLVQYNEIAELDSSIK